MFFFDWVHSLLVRDCYHVMRYWVMRAFWSGYYDREYFPPLRYYYDREDYPSLGYPDVDLWHKSWVLGHDWRTEQGEVRF